MIANAKEKAQYIQLKLDSIKVFYGLMAVKTWKNSSATVLQGSMKKRLKT